MRFKSRLAKLEDRHSARVDEERADPHLWTRRLVAADPEHARAAQLVHDRSDRHSRGVWCTGRPPMHAGHWMMSLYFQAGLLWLFEPEHLASRLDPSAPCAEAYRWRHGAPDPEAAEDLFLALAGLFAAYQVRTRELFPLSGIFVRELGNPDGKTLKMLTDAIAAARREGAAPGWRRRGPVEGEPVQWP